MPATLASSLFLHSCADERSVENRESTDSVALQGGPFLRSDDLLQGRKTVAIAHNGLIYRLQATRLGKLILTK